MNKDSRNAKILELHMLGLSNREIAEVTKCSATTVSRVIKAAGSSTLLDKEITAAIESGNTVNLEIYLGDDPRVLLSGKILAQDEETILLEMGTVEDTVFRVYSLVVSKFSIISMGRLTRLSELDYDESD